MECEEQGNNNGVELLEKLFNKLDTLEVKEVNEEPVSEELEKAAKNHAVERYRVTRDMVLAEKCKWSFQTGAKWKEQQMMAKAIDATCFGFQGAALFSFRLPASNYLVGSEVKVIVIKKD